MIEQRCPHGFLRSVAPCPLCGGAPPVRVPVEKRKGQVEDLTGTPMAGVFVVERAENTSKGNAAWHVRLRCGHLKTVQGSHLRKIHSSGGMIRCAEGCRPNVVKAAAE